MSRRGSPRPLADSIRTLRTEVQPATPLAAIQAVWPDAVGARIAAEARPVRERDGTVTVECRAATWAQELDLLHDELLDQGQRGARIRARSPAARHRRRKFVPRFTLVRDLQGFSIEWCAVPGGRPGILM